VKKSRFVICVDFLFFILYFLLFKNYSNESTTKLNHHKEFSLIFHISENLWQ
jgi:hypothetical protein